MNLTLKCPACEALGSEQSTNNPFMLSRYVMIPGIPPVLNGESYLTEFRCPNGHSFYLPFDDVDKIRQEVG